MEVHVEPRAVLWHRRMAHLSYNALAEMSAKQLVHGMPVTAADFRREASQLK